MPPPEDWPASTPREHAGGEAIVSLRRQVSSVGDGKEFVICIDGSSTGDRGVRLAAMLMKERDRLSIVTVPAKGDRSDDSKGLLASAESYARHIGLRGPQISTEVVSLKDGWTLPGAIIHLANHRQGAVVVMGAAGRGAESAAKTSGNRPHGQPPMGSVAKEVMERCKVPVILVKAVAIPQLDKTDLHLRDRRTGEVSLKICCTIDGTTLSQKAFDTALHLCRSCDTLTVVHVDDSDQAVIHAVSEGQTHSMQQSLSTLAAVRSYYENECSKAEIGIPGLRTRLVVAHKVGSIRETVLDTTEGVCDVMVMGSTTMSKGQGNAGGGTSVGSTPRLFLGSVAAAIAKQSSYHACVIKGYTGLI